LFFRPDTTLVKESKDFYLPDDCVECSISPAIAFYIDKAGKYIGKDFILRYLSSAYISVLIHPKYNSILEPDINYNFVINSVDNSTYIGSKLFQIDNSTDDYINIIMESNDILFVDNNSICNITINVKQVIEQAFHSLHYVSKQTSFRKGDFLIIQLSEKLTFKTNQTLVLKNNNQVLFCFDIK
jgi:hypothetical protein